MKSIFVIGGGLVGVSTAIWLQRLGEKVTLLDRNLSRSRVSLGNAGVLTSSSYDSENRTPRIDYL